MRRIYRSVRRPRHDEEGVMDMPYRIIITVLLLLVTMAIAWEGLKYFSESQVKDDLNMELQNLERRLFLCYEAGAGTSLKVDFRLPEGILLSVDEVRIGDELDGKHQHIIEYWFSDGSSDWEILDDPMIRMTSHMRDDSGSIIGSGPLILTSENNELKVTHMDDGSRSYVDVVLL